MILLLQNGLPSPKHKNRIALKIKMATVTKSNHQMLSSLYVCLCWIFCCFVWKLLNINFSGIVQRWIPSLATGKWNDCCEPVWHIPFLYTHQLHIKYLRPSCCPLAHIWARLCENVSYAICEQQKCRSACTSTQFDQHLCCSLLR